MAEIFPNEGLDLIYGGFPKGATGSPVYLRSAGCRARMREFLRRAQD